MNRARLIRSIALPLAALTLAIAPAIGCSGGDPTSVEQQPAAQNVRVTADDLSALGAGETLRLDFAESDVLYHFHFDRPLDYAKITMVFDGAEVPMSTAMEELLASPYTPHNASDQRFTLTSRPENFAELTAEEVEALRADGMLMKEKTSSGTGVSPQSVNDCITQTTYELISIVVNGQVFEYWCEHVYLICDGEPACSELLSNDGHSYIFCNNQESWSGARAYCNDFNMKLVSLGSAAEEEWVYAIANVLSPQKWWIGLNDKGAEGSFVWDSGEAVSYSNWEPGEPNNVGGSEDCGQLNRYHPAKTWNDEPCSLHLNFICESQ
jgi:predicted DNA-binding protein (UPF0251 family)